MSKRKAFLDAVCKENVEDFLRFIRLHVSSFLLIYSKNIRTVICIYLCPFNTSPYNLFLLNYNTLIIA